MDVRPAVAVATLVLGLATASRVEAASCGCASAAHRTVHHRAHHSNATGIEIVYGDHRSPRRTTPAPEPAYDVDTYEAPGPVYEAYPAYYGYGYAAPVVYGPGWGYRGVSRYPGYVWRGHPAGRYPAYGWRGGYYGGGFRGGGVYMHAGGGRR